jgi:hypothetical protein
MNLKEMSEAELREVKTLWPKTLDELNQIIKDLTERQHDYGTCVYAMSLCAEATFNYVASTLGCTGFQASCADLTFIGRTRSMKDGFSIVDYNKLLYPQYLTAEHFPSIPQLIEKNKEQLKKRATELLADAEHVDPTVKAHWEKIAEL